MKQVGSRGTAVNAIHDLTEKCAEAALHVETH